MQSSPQTNSVSSVIFPQTELLRKDVIKNAVDSLTAVNNASLTPLTRPKTYARVASAAGNFPPPTTQRMHVDRESIGQAEGDGSKQPGAHINER
jgi:hypothetical protein